MSEFVHNNDEEVVDAERGIEDSIEREREDAFRTEIERRDYFAARRYNRSPLIIALLGLLLSVVYGSGIILGIVGLVTALVHNSRKPSRTLRWAIAVSTICIVLCLAFFGFLAAASTVLLPQPRI